jgi:hypothetical protein
MRHSPGPWLAMAALALCAACEPAGAPGAAARAADQADFAPVNRSDVTGTVGVERDDGEAIVTIELVGLRPGAVYPAHVHDGRCAAGGTVAAPLGRITAGRDGRGRLRTRVAGTALAPDRPAFVQIQTEDGTALACADLSDQVEDDGGAEDDGADAGAEDGGLGRGGA